MPLVRTPLANITHSWESPAATELTSATIEPGANCLLLLICAGVQDSGSGLFQDTPVTSSGSGPTWEEISNSLPEGAFNAHAGIYKAEIGGTDPGEFAVEIDFPDVGQEGRAGQFIGRIIRYTGYDTTTPLVAPVTTSDGPGVGAVSFDLVSAPAVGDIVEALTLSDSGGSPGSGTFDDTQGRTWVRDFQGSDGPAEQNTGCGGYSTGSTDTTVAWSQINDNGQDWSSAQAAVIVKAGAGGAVEVNPVGARVAARCGVASITVPSTDVEPVKAFVPATCAVATITATANVAPVGATVAATCGVGRVVRGAPTPTTVKLPERKLLDQYGDPIHIRTLSAWALAQNAPSLADITDFMETAAGLGFNAVTVAPWGNSYGGEWHPYDNELGDSYFAGGDPTSDLDDDGWETFDWVLSEAQRLDMFVLFSWYAGPGDSGAFHEFIKTMSTSECRALGQRVATKYADVDNFMWHFVFDATFDSTIAANMDAIAQGIADVEGAGTRRIVTVEQNDTGGAFDQYLDPPVFDHLDIKVDSLYLNFSGSSVEWWDDVYSDSADAGSPMPVWDCEPCYGGNNRYNDGNDVANRQNIRERTMTVYIRGGVGINNSHEKLWVAGYPGAGGWADTMSAFSSPEVIEFGHANTFVEQMNQLAWGPDDDLIVTGLSSGDDKAAGGSNGSDLAIAYFPTSRTVAVDTTVCADLSAVRLRWWNPQTGDYTLVSASEAPSSSRSVSYPSAHSDGTSDFVLVVDAPAPAEIAGTTALVAAVCGVVSVTATAQTTPTGAAVTATAGVAAITATAPVAPVGARVAARCGVPAVTATAAVAPTGAQVAATAGVAAIVGTAQVAPTGALVGATAAVADVQTGAVIDGTTANVTTTTAVAAIVGTAQVTPTGAVVAAQTGTGAVAATATVTPTGATVAATAGVADVASGAVVQAATAVVAASCAVANIGSAGVINATGAHVAVHTAVAELTATANVTPVGMLVAATCGVASIALFLFGHATSTVRPRGTATSTISPSTATSTVDS